ncbi:MAG: polysaccharide biosynthesis protein [Anaerolineae bacterium]|nr:polysaccharide biosynthesis protein [Anaerolineae bacterium]
MLRATNRQKSPRPLALGLRTLQVRNRYLLLVDMLTIPLAAYFAFVLRLDLRSLDIGGYSHTALVFATVAFCVKIVVLLKLDGYSRYWPFASMPELDLMVKAVVAGEIITTSIALVVLHILSLPQFPLSIPLLDLFLSGYAVVAPRLLLRWLYYNALKRERKTGTHPQKRVLIIGAGKAGYTTLLEINRNPELGLLPVGFVDDDPAKKGMTLGGDVRVLGAAEDIPALVKTLHVQQILIAIPTATSDEMRRIVGICRQTPADVLTLPGVYELISEQVQVQRFRPVNVTDLLARPQVQSDSAEVAALLSGHCVLVTGAGGSIGSELCRQIARCKPAALVLLGHGENSIYHIHKELCEHFPDLTLHAVIADVRDAGRVDQVFAQHKPEIIFHAAAHKHVPLMEANPLEAVTNNVGGTRTLLHAAETWGVEHFVLISTDKAVEPRNIMGATKHVAESLVRVAAQRSGRAFVAVRFGNVLGSRGSVIPLFQQQIAAGGPLTITHPDVERYFMTIPEAAQLVLQAATLGQGGEVFVLDMGQPVKIVDLARDVIRLSGLEEGKDIDIVFTGLRPGEKLYEELFATNEHHARSRHQKIFFAQNGHIAVEQVEEDVGRLLEAASAGDYEEIMVQLGALAPGYMGEESTR